ncbi:hypothetical protein IQ215_05350 [Cyanobacterium stanieri LEGE 03274]|uniref:Uncharacterized protein n=1 Tax=Cyanobacterium stanieri LEGE 03274 TaxID=1828756 RepID=A0ABR9V2K4_9CHRO|nr:hypothetical protein [Cyanobacterium stanieri]MBE9222118.1 hypothetical protein [Cyanobacterium stanieri LEGE 03274]
MNNQPNHNPFILELGISLLTPPILLGLTISREVGEMMDNLGSASEEIFRGQHLPILKTKPKT